MYPALLSLGAGMLASCTGEQVEPPPPTSAVRPLPSPLAVSPPAATPRPARKPNPPSPIEGSAPAGLEASLPPSGPAAASISPSPATSPPPQDNELIGLDQPAATRLFGPAPEQSEEAPATVWRYKNGTCELDLFFYLDLRSGSMRTLHYAFKGDGTDSARRQDCLRSLFVARSD
jgi:hypothetical protein